MKMPLDGEAVLRYCRGRRRYIYMVLGGPKARERLVPKLRLGTGKICLFVYLGALVVDFLTFYTKFCCQCNQPKFQIADNPGLFNRKPITDNRKRY